jgi:hypothetical protein
MLLITGIALALGFTKPHVSEAPPALACSCNLFNVATVLYFIVWVYHNLFIHSTMDGI